MHGSVRCPPPHSLIRRGGHRFSLGPMSEDSGPGALSVRCPPPHLRLIYRGGHRFLRGHRGKAWYPGLPLPL